MSRLGSVPLQQFPRYILGVRPSAPGFAAVTINPVPSDLDHAEGTVPTPHGPIRVGWERVDADWRRVSVRMPSTITFDPDQSTHGVTQSLSGDTKELTFQQNSLSPQFSLIR